MTNLRHHDDWSTVRFVTFSCYLRLPSLNESGAKEFFIEDLDRARSRHSFQLLGYVLMPEHVHLVLNPPDDMKLGSVIRELKSRSAKRYFAESHATRRGQTRVFWQRHCYDHNCRTADTVREKVRYCHKNPVRRGLVNDPADREWSSYNWYRGRKSVPIQMDEVPLG